MTDKIKTASAETPAVLSPRKRFVFLGFLFLLPFLVLAGITGFLGHALRDQKQKIGRAHV